MYKKLTDQEQIKWDKLTELKNNNQNPFAITGCKRTYVISEFIKTYNDFSKEELHEKFDNEQISLVGRVMNQRQTFGVIKDFSGRIQFYLNKKNVDKDTFHYFKKIDIGDIVNIIGSPMKTMTGELTINIKKIQIISKSLKVLPEKFHGLVDEELRARERYVDLIMNDDSMKTFVLRSKIIKTIREYMDSQNFLEVETPVLQPILGGAAARPFTTHHNALDREYYLRIATELPLKKLIVGGFDKVYEIGRIFRNEGMDATHNPEFTSMEAYQALANMEDTMELCENVIKYTVDKLFDKKIFSYRGFEIDLGKPFQKKHMCDFVKEVTGIDFRKITDDKEALALAKKHNIELKKHENKVGHVLNGFFEAFCEEKIIQPTFVYGHPVEVSPLSKMNNEDNRYTDRFELFIGQKEFANAFAELNDPEDQYNRFAAQLKEKELGNDEANEMDYDFINALEYGLPPTGGLGIGIDRLVMLLTEKNTIRDVLLFPHMKDKN